MKNMRDKEWLDKLAKRLDEYSEQPDDALWDRIAPMVQSSPQPRWTQWVTVAGALTSAIILSLSLPRVMTPDTVFDQHAGVEQREPTSLPKAKALEQQQEILSRDLSVPAGDDGDAQFEEESSDQNPAIETNSIVNSNEDVLTDQTVDPRNVESSLLGNLDSEEEVADSVSAEKVADELRPEEAETRKPSRKRRPVLYGSISSSLAFNKIIPDKGDGVAIGSIVSRPVLAHDRIGFTLNTGVQLRISRSLEVYSGLSLYRQSHRLIYEFNSDQTTITSDAAGIVLTPGVVQKTVAYDMLNAGVEAGVLYLLTGDRVLHKLGVGLAWHHGLRKAREGETYDNSRSQYLSYQLSYRTEFAVDNRMIVYFQPFYRHVFSSQESLSEPMRLKPYYAGIGIGLIYQAGR